MKNESWVQTLKDYVMLTVGTMLIAIGVYFFKFPNHFSTGGVSGISIILAHYAPNLSAGAFVFIINMALLALGFAVFGRSFGVRTAYTSLVLSCATWGLEYIVPMDAPMTSQPLLELIFAVGLPAVGSAILFNMQASSGGTDIVAMILKRHTSVNIGNALLLSDLLITLSAFFIFDIKTFLFSMLGLFSKSLVIDNVIESINLCKFFSIVTSKPDEICDFIIKDLHHSSTVVDGQGAFSHQDKKVVLTAVRRGEAVRLRQKCKQIDPHSFMFITNTSEIIGKGFHSV